MSIQLYDVMNNIMSMGYYQNENARSVDADYGHEAAVAIKINKGGFDEELSATYPKLKKGMLKKWAETGDDTLIRIAIKDMPIGTYMIQPAGTQGFPDILVKDFNDRIIAIECKSGKAGKTPMWNDNLPKPNTIYILSSGSVNETTIFLGKDVMSETILISQQQMIVELTEVMNKYRKINKELDTFNRGWDIKFRPQNFQAGGKEKTNYFTHCSRALCEHNALEFSKK